MLEEVFCGDCCNVLDTLDTRKIQVNLVYLDPPFNTGKTQSRKSKDFYYSYEDAMEVNAWKKFIAEMVYKCYRLLTPDGSLFFHINEDMSMAARELLDKTFYHPDNRINTIIRCWDYGGRGKNNYAEKHDVIYWYAKDRHKYIFNYDEISYIPYEAPRLVGEEKAARGKKDILDVWRTGIVPTMSKENCGYPTQKPLKLLEQIVRIHSNPGDIVLDPCCGSGTTGVAAKKLGRKYILIDSNPQAIDIVKTRLAEVHVG